MLPQRETVQPYAEHARPYYVDKDIAHDWRHIERILRRLDSLADGRPVQRSCAGSTWTRRWGCAATAGSRRPGPSLRSC